MSMGPVVSCVGKGVGGFIWQKFAQMDGLEVSGKEFLPRLELCFNRGEFRLQTLYGLCAPVFQCLF